ncbi:MAG: leucyl/phenylalanyl-tRNA--protein transferase [Actinomycetota bacterium]|nr:leucyl/phenylalanyl-tRNA--protein transferase [Actinomycetota bacterium]
MSLNSRDPGISKFAIPSLGEMINILANSNFSSDLIFHGGDLSPATLLDAYRSGLFPMPLENRHLGWFCPAQRGIFITVRRKDQCLPAHISRSLRKSIDRFSFSVNLAFDQVISGCANPERTGSWITAEIKEAYTLLHKMGWAHSFEVWTGNIEAGDLAGGLYGVAIGGLFAGESMFHNTADASKAALVALISMMMEQGGILIDAQWNTDHLASMGAVTIPRIEYLGLLEEALSLPCPEMFAEPHRGQIDLNLETNRRP